ncbi:MAG TPA: TlpA disulfide reductase family protein [Thermoplasmata archaeon]|nr:TlpA disulfide reductase family protein [Thermoplasmata archaeon]
MTLRKCPVCGSSVKLENLERHVRNRHPREDVDVSALLTREERRRTARRRPARPAVTRRGVQVVAVVAVLVAVLFVLALWNPFRGVGPNVGQYAPDFALTTTEGGAVALSGLRGSPVLLEFMDIDCGACRDETATFVTVYAEYSARGVRFLSVDVDSVGQSDTAERINEFRQTHGTYWSYMIEDAATQRAYGVDQTPTTFVIDRNGIVTFKLVGRASGGAATYRDALEKALEL